MDVNEFRTAAKAAIDEITTYHETVASRRPVAKVEPGYLRPLLPSSAPLDPEPFETIRADIQDKIMPGITHWASPGFMAFYPCSSSFPADIAEMYSNAFNGAHFNWVCSPAVTELETIVMDWIAHAFGLPECFTSGGPTSGGGVIHGSASEAILTVMVAARDKYITAKLGRRPGADGEPATEEEKEEYEDRAWPLRSKLVAVGSGGTHSAFAKAAQVLGIRCVTIPTREEDGFALTGARLAQTLEQLDAKGLEPFFVVATLGTTEVCAVDDFAGIAAALRRRRESQPAKPDVFVHVDAAYAGTALLLPEQQYLAKDFSHFHSFNFNPHKWMLTTFDCSALFVRSRDDLVNALSIKPPFLRNQHSDSKTVTDYRDWQIPLGRRFRSLKLWFVLRSYGIRGLQEHCRTGIRLCELLEEKLVSRKDLFMLLTGARFGLLTLRVVGSDEAEVNRRTEAVYDDVNRDGAFYLTHTVVGGKYVIRVNTTGKLVSEESVEKLFDVLVRQAELRCGEAVQVVA